MKSPDELAREIIECGPVVFGAKAAEHYQNAIAQALRECGDARLEEAAAEVLALGKYVRGGYTNAAFEAAERIRALKGGK